MPDIALLMPNPNEFDVACNCGKVYHTRDEHIGRCLKCAGCGRTLPIQRSIDTSLECSQPHDTVDTPPPSAKCSEQRREATPSTLMALLRTIFAVSLFLALALLLSELLLVLLHHWLYYLPRRNQLYPYLNAGMVIALGFAGASGVILLLLLNKPALRNCASGLLRFGERMVEHGRSALKWRARPAIIVAVLLCAVGALFWAYRSKEKSKQQVSDIFDIVAEQKSNSDSNDLGTQNQKQEQPPVLTVTKSSDRSQLPARFSEEVLPEDRTQPPPGFDIEVPKRERRRKTPKAPGAGANLPDIERVPVVPNPADYNRLPNGTQLAGCVGTGLGELAVYNGTDLDAVVRLVRSDSSEVCWFYVQSKRKVTKNGIVPGAYTLMYTTGAEWDDAAAEFRKAAKYNEFERSLTYVELPDGENVTKYKTVSVTLNPVPDGNVTTRHISRQEFLKGHQNQRVSR